MSSIKLGVSCFGDGRKQVFSNEKAPGKIFGQNTKDRVSDKMQLKLLH